MATSAVPMKPRREMVEVKAPELFQFNKIGQMLAGFLRSIEPTLLTDKQSGEQKEAIEFLFENEKGDRFTCLGVNDLLKKIQSSHIGHWVEIRYDSDDHQGQKPGQSARKIFKVLVSKEAA